MRFFFDTEFFDNGAMIYLISIGIAAEDGRTYYAEFVGKDSSFFKGDEWLRKNVKPNLIGPIRDRDAVAEEIQYFVGSNPEFWAYVSAYDWVVLNQLYGSLTQGPKTWPWMALDTYQLPDFKRYVVKSETPHNALADAIALRESWSRWRAAYPDYLLPTDRKPRG